jgi:hypothetical protein
MLSRLPSLYLSSLLLLPGTFDCSDRRERKHSHSTECPKFRLSAQSKVIEPVVGKKGLQSRISPICTLSQNGYGACPAVLSPKQCFCRFWISEVSLTDFLVCWRAGRRAGGWRAGGRAAGGRVAAAGGRAAGPPPNHLEQPPSPALRGNVPPSSPPTPGIPHPPWL